MKPAHLLGFSRQEIAELLEIGLRQVGYVVRPDTVRVRAIKEEGDPMYIRTWATELPVDTYGPDFIGQLTKEALSFLIERLEEYRSEGKHPRTGETIHSFVHRDELPTFDSKISDDSMVRTWVWARVGPQVIEALKPLPEALLVPDSLEEMSWNFFPAKKKEPWQRNGLEGEGITLATKGLWFTALKPKAETP